MTLDELLADLDQRCALIVHCSRAARDGEKALNSPPLYPDDLRGTIQDLAKGSREISCSVVWPQHQHSFGAVGIVVRPHSTQAILRMGTSDVGNIEGLGGLGSPFSRDMVDKTFDECSDYNEWVVRGGDVEGLFINLTMQLEIAEERAFPIEQISEDQRAFAPQTVVGAVQITLDELRADFPDFPIYTFVRGTLVTISPSARPYL